VTFKQYLTRGAIVFFVLLTTVMWVYAFVFSSREAINKIEDAQWQQRAESICVEATLERGKLADYRLISSVGADALLQRADLVDEATEILDEMLDDIARVEPTDAKGKALVPLWLADYRTYLNDRLEYTAELRSGVNDPFSETMIDGLPLSEKISTFAADNLMPSCKAPIDLSV
jgi:hypothetical protein